jgi:hypothetical protein
MPEAIVTRILRLAGYAAYAHELEETTSRLTLWVRQMADAPYYACGGCGISIRDVHSWSERRVVVGQFESPARAGCAAAQSSSPTISSIDQT